MGESRTMAAPYPPIEPYDHGMLDTGDGMVPRPRVAAAKPIRCRALAASSAGLG